MDYITTTDLRTRSSELINTLKNGGTVSLIHRSRVVGEIKPKIYDPKPFDPVKFAQIVNKLNFPKLTPRQIDARYRTMMMKKHGKNIS